MSDSVRYIRVRRDYRHHNLASPVAPESGMDIHRQRFEKPSEVGAQLALLKGKPIVLEELEEPEAGEVFLGEISLNGKWPQLRNSARLRLRMHAFFARLAS
jgi:hypothetical protein